MNHQRLLIFVLLLCLSTAVVPVSAQTAEPTACPSGSILFQSDVLATDPVCIPEHPQRIAAVDTFTLETLLALGIQPVAGPFLQTFLRDHAEYKDQLANATDIEWPVDPEAIVASHPDLIISIQPWIKDIAGDVAKIAPTVSLTYAGDDHWQDIALAVGSAVNQEDAINNALAAYAARLKAFQDWTTKNPVGDVGVVFLLPDSIAPFMSDTFGGSIVNAAGLKFPQALVDATADGTLTDISKERLDLLQTSDYIFVVTSGFTDADLATYKQLEATLAADPLWQALPAVKAKHVSIVGRDWLGSSLIAANHVVDDLFTDIAGVDPATVSPDPYLPAQATPEATAAASAVR